MGSRALDCAVVLHPIPNPTRDPAKFLAGSLVLSLPMEPSVSLCAVMGHVRTVGTTQTGKTHYHPVRMDSSQSVTAGDRAIVDTIVRSALAVLLIGQATIGYTDSDIWGHMSIGLDMLRDRRFLWVDPYSFTHDQPWVNHEWLWDLVTAALYRSGDLPALLGLRAAAIATVVWLVDRATRPAPPMARLALLAILGLACVGQWRSTRPQLATLALYATTLANIQARWLPVLFAAWANLHGGWIYGLAAVGLRAVFTRRGQPLVTAALCALATLINPYGIHLWTAILGATTRGWTDLTEWQPVWRLAAGADALALWILLAASAAWLWRRVAPDPWAWTWTLLTLAAAAQSRRLTGLAAVTLAMLVVPAWTSVTPNVPIAWTPRRRLSSAAVLAASAALAAWWVWPSATCFPPMPAWRAPEADAVAFIRSAGVHRVLPHFDYGEYAIYHLRPDVKVGIDNRRETVYSATAVADNQRFTDGADPDYPLRIGADAVWWPSSDRELLRTLEARGWVRHFEGPRTVVLLRRPGSLVHGRHLPGHPCFPEP